jgi:hypothetical protein
MDLMIDCLPLYEMIEDDMKNIINFSISSNSSSPGCLSDEEQLALTSCSMFDDLFFLSTSSSVNTIQQEKQDQLSSYSPSDIAPVQNNLLPEPSDRVNLTNTNNFNYNSNNNNNNCTLSLNESFNSSTFSSYSSSVSSAACSPISITTSSSPLSLSLSSSSLCAALANTTFSTQSSNSSSSSACSSALSSPPSTPISNQYNGYQQNNLPTIKSLTLAKTG